MNDVITRRDFIGTVSAASLVAAGAGNIFANEAKKNATESSSQIDRAERKSGYRGISLQPISFEFTFGLKDETSAKWDGSLEVVSANSKLIKADVIDNFPEKSSVGLEVEGNKLRWNGGSQRSPHPEWVKVNNSKVLGYIPEIHDYSPLKLYTFVVTVVADNYAQIKVDIADKGSFTFPIANVPLGRSEKFLDGSVLVRRAAASSEIMELDNSELPIRYNDFPSICTTSDGSTYTAFVSFLGGSSPLLKPDGFPRNSMANLDDTSFLKDKVGGDRLMLVREQGGKVFPPQALTQSGQNIYSVQIASDNNRLCVVWSQKNGGIWDLYFRICSSGGRWSPPQKLSTGIYPDIHPAVASGGGNFHICWQGFNKKDSGFVTSDIFYVKVSGDSMRFSNPVAVSKTGGNNWAPAIAVSHLGKVAIAWDSYQKGDYDVYYSILDSNDCFSESMPAAASRKFEATVSIIFDKDERLWVAYEEADENWGKDKGDESYVTKKGVNINMGRKIRLKCFKDGNVYEPAMLPSDAIPMEASYTYGYYKMAQNPLEYAVYCSKNHYLSFPVLMMDAKGGINLIYKKQLLNAQGMYHSVIFANYIIRFDGIKWSEPVLVADSDGHSYQKPAVAALGDGVVIASASDRSASTAWSTNSKNNNVRLSKAVFDDEVGGYRVLTSDEISVDPPKKAIVQEKQDVEFMRRFSSITAGKELRIFRGDSHRHTTFSRDGGGDGSILDCMRYSLDAAALDWVSNGDHDNGSREYTWYITQKFHDVFSLDAHFIGMFGYERSVNYPRGHRNVIMANSGIRFLPREPGISEDRLYRFCKDNEAVCIAHTTATSAAGTNWSFNDSVAEPVIEIYQGCRNSYEYPGAPRSSGGDSKCPGFYWDALRKGFKMGIIASSDHRSTHCSYAMVYTDNPTRLGIIEALRKRHCYGATDNITLEVKMGDYMMGDIFETASPAKLEIYFRGSGRVKQIDIIKNCEIAATLQIGKQEDRIVWTDEGITQPNNHYYVRIMQDDGELAWSSPMWITFV